MNEFCSTCKNSCEELIPTYQCNEQMNKKGLTEILEELKNVHSVLYYNMDDLIKEVNSEVSEVKNNPTIDSVVTDFHKLSFEDKKHAFKKMVTLGNMGENIESKVFLITLITTFYVEIKKKSPEKTITDVVNFLVEEQSLINLQSEKERVKESLILLCEEFAIGSSKGNTFGLKGTEALKTKINELVQQIIPF